MRLLSCSVGSTDDGFAQNLSNKLGVDVLAPSTVLWALPTGRYFMADEIIDNKLINQVSTMRLFHPRKRS